MPVSPDVDPAEVARWLHLESERLRRVYEDVSEWCDRRCELYDATAADPDVREKLKQNAADLRNLAYGDWWRHTEEFAPVVMEWIERQMAKRQLAERQRVAATLGWVRRPWQTGPEF